MNESAGRLLNSAPDLATFLQYEKSTTPSHIRELFEDIDALTREFLFYSFDEVKKRYHAPQDFIVIPPGVPQYQLISFYLFTFNPTTIVSKLSRENQDRLRTHFNGERQLQQGAVWLDSRKTFYVPGLPQSEQISARLVDDPNVLFYLALAKPALQVLLQFMDLHRGSPLIKTKDFELESSSPLSRQYDSGSADAAWFERARHQYSDLDIEVFPFLTEVESATHFLSLSKYERQALVDDFLNRLQESVAKHEVVERFRAMQLQTALHVYYRFAEKAHKPIPRKRFLNESTQMVLSGYFEGSWIKFLEYVQEQPAEDDYISTQVPKPQVLIPLKINIGPSELPAGEAERILDSLDASGSGLRARFALAREFWDTLMNLHAARKPGVGKLRVLVEGVAVYWDYYFEKGDDGYWNPSVFLKLLPQELIARIDALFGRQTSSEYPTARASALFPYATFCSHLNPALLFWNRVGLTTWDATWKVGWQKEYQTLQDFSGKNILEQLADWGCPIDGDMRSWTERHFEAFWQGRYRTKVAECGRRYNRLREVTGSDPAISKFVNQEVVTVVNEYFSGNVFSLLEVLGEPLPKGTSIRDDRLIRSIDKLRSALQEFANRELPELHKQLRVRDLFIMSALRYCISWEGRGTKPRRSMFNSDFYHQELLKALGFDPAKDPVGAWTEFSRLVERAAAPALLSDLHD